MTITSYATLQTQVADFLNRSDLTSQIPTFIQLAEASMNRKLRHWRMETRSRADVSTQYADLPSDWLETVRYNIVGDRRMSLISHAELMDRREATENTAGKPRFYAHVAGDLELYPTPDATYSTELLYYAKIPALSDDNTSNWLLTNAPDAYLYGALTHSAPYLQEDSRIQVWGGLYADVMSSLTTESAAAKHSGSSLALRPR